MSFSLSTCSESFLLMPTLLCAVTSLSFTRWTLMNFVANLLGINCAQSFTAWQVIQIRSVTWIKTCQITRNPKYVSNHCLQIGSGVNHGAATMLKQLLRP